MISKRPARLSLRPALDEERGGAKQEDPQLPALGGVLVPEPLDHLRPTTDLLNLVEHQEAASAAILFGAQATERPLRLDPGGVSPDRIIGRRIVGREVDCLHDLPRQGRLADLPGAGQDLDKTAR